MIGPAPICFECARFHGMPAKPFAPWTCDAFPKGIPQSIIESERDHREPYVDAFDDDGGLTFLPLYPSRLGETTGNPLLLDGKS
jgi:hypothetical protein